MKPVNYYKPVARISTKDRKKIRISILSCYHSYTEFCEDYEDFDCVYISNVINGKLKLKSTKYIKLISTLTEYHNLKLN